MKKKKFSKNLHDVKKDLGLATGDYDDFNSTIILFVLSWYCVIFIKHLE